MVEKPNDSNGPISGHGFLDSAGVQKWAGYSPPYSPVGSPAPCGGMPMAW
jgi:hypothetical protein